MTVSARELRIHAASARSLLQDKWQQADSQTRPALETEIRALLDLENEIAFSELENVAVELNRLSSLLKRAVAVIKNGLLKLETDKLQELIAQLQAKGAIGQDPDPPTPTSPSPKPGTDTLPSAGGGANSSVSTQPDITNINAQVEAARILAIAERHLGQPYRNVTVDLTADFWTGPFDCAKFASYCVYRAYGILFGTRPEGKVRNAEAYTGYWKVDAEKRGARIDVREALATAGAFLLRYPPAPGEMGHIAISLGNGNEVFEAHSVNRGVIRNSGRDRRWDTGVRLPGVTYVEPSHRLMGMPMVYRFIDGRAAYDENVELIQEALAAHGFLDRNSVTGIFDRATQDAVLRFQTKHNLLRDGEVGRETGRTLGLIQLWEADDIERPSSTTPLVLDARQSHIRSTNFFQIRDEYLAMYRSAQILPSWEARARQLAEESLGDRQVYEAVSQKTNGIPWFFIAAIHNMESTRRFTGHLHNGDPLPSRTVHEPKGRPVAPPANGREYTWEESALDALRLKKLQIPVDWSLPRLLYRMEAYNGFGSRQHHGVPTAYLWSGTNYYERGKYVQDGVWDENATSSQIGCVTLLKALEGMNAIKL